MDINRRGFLFCSAAAAAVWGVAEVPEWKTSYVKVVEKYVVTFDPARGPDETVIWERVG